MPFEFGDVVLVSFPFTNQSAFKQRPAVVVSNSAYNAARQDVIVVAITSQFRPTASLGEVWISHWQAANLLKPSAIKPVFATIEQTLIRRHLGVLHEEDQSALRKSIYSVIA
jgi:mRNA interferase MazF